MLSEKELIELVLASFDAEKNSNIDKNMEYVHDDFTVTDMVSRSDGSVLPKISGNDLRSLMKKAFEIKGREFIFLNIIADAKTQTVMIEFIESYPDPQTKQIYRTPQIAVCVIKEGKILRTRHYMDPRLSYSNLTQETIDEALK